MVHVLFCVSMLVVGGAGSVPDEPVRITRGPTIENVTSNAVTVAWSTNVNASTIVHYGKEAANLTSKAEEPWGGLTHRVTISNLAPGTTYYFQVESSQAQGSGTSVASEIEEFTTKANSRASTPLEECE